jgi:NAD(P)-dependent dehydrogenase (short-subunit alcohol dehydrogenase family)
LLSKGCNVVVADLGLRPEAKEHYDGFTSSPRAIFQKTDVTKWSDLEAMFNLANKEFGGVDILCAGAGLFDPKFSNFWFPPGSELSRDDPHGDKYLTMDVNVTHPIRSTQLALSHWLNPQKGQEKASTSNPKRVVVCCSIASYLSGISYPLYFASKAAVAAFVRSLGDLDGKLGIKVAGVCPGGVKSPMLVEDEQKARTIDFEKDQLVTVEEVAALLYKLCVDDSIKGGSLIEITEKGTREVPAFGNMGPDGGTNSKLYNDTPYPRSKSAYAVGSKKVCNPTLPSRSMCNFDLCDLQRMNCLLTRVCDSLALGSGYR